MLMWVYHVRWLGTGVRASNRAEVYTPCTCRVPSRRQNRAGARSGIISVGLEAALSKEAHALGGVVGAVDRIQAINDFFAGLDFELEQFADVRLEAVRELRAQGWSYDRIANATNLSKARVAQLVRETRRR